MDTTCLLDLLEEVVVVVGFGLLTGSTTAFPLWGTKGLEFWGNWVTGI